VRASAGEALTGLRVALGTLSVLPVRAPLLDDSGRLASRAAVDPPPWPPAAGWAMLWAPVVGLLLGGLALGGALLIRAVGGGDPLAAVVAVALLAAGTRGLHLDGLADTVDGLGVGRDAARALRVMKSSDTGPFAVITLVLVLLAQVASIDRALGAGHGALAVPLAAVVGRLTLAPACRPAVPAARPTGLGALVAGRVPGLAAAVVTGLTLAASAAAGLLAGVGPWRPLLATALGLLAGEALLRHCRRRFGGVTGDVLGALVETATTVALVVLATA
jgi:adenosylcobinamide-GDP ribazoletransferase